MNQRHLIPRASSFAFKRQMLRRHRARQTSNHNMGEPQSFGPTAAQSLIKLDNGEELVELGLGERILGREKLLLGF